MKRLATLLVFAAWLGGCGLSPQTVQMEPAPDVESANVGHNAAVLVTVDDQRERDEIGTRGGIYAETSLLRPANKVDEALLGAIQRGLQNQGFNAFNPGGDATRLQVALTELSYKPEDSSVVNRVEVGAELEVRAERPEADYTGRYRSTIRHDQPFTPSARRNETLLNDVMNRALNRMLADNKLLAFLAGEDEPEGADEDADGGEDSDNGEAEADGT